MPSELCTLQLTLITFNNWVLYTYAHRAFDPCPVNRFDGFYLTQWHSLLWLRRHRYRP